MKTLSLIMLGITVSIIGQEKKPSLRSSKVSFASPETPNNSPSGSAIKRTKELASFDSVFEPKPTQSLCANHCICIDCLTKASCELEKIQHKLPYLQILVNRSKREEKNNTKISISGPEAIAAARMIVNLKKTAKEGKKLNLFDKTKDKKSTKSEKKSEKDKKEPKSKFSAPKLKRSVDSSRSHRLTTPSDHKAEEEFNQLTNPKENSFSWRLRQAGADIP